MMFDGVRRCSMSVGRYDEDKCLDSSSGITERNEEPSLLGWNIICRSHENLSTDPVSWMSYRIQGFGGMVVVRQIAFSISVPQYFEYEDNRMEGRNLACRVGDSTLYNQVNDMLLLFAGLSLLVSDNLLPLAIPIPSFPPPYPDLLKYNYLSPFIMQHDVPKYPLP